jgi:hypothetical protein
VPGWVTGRAISPVPAGTGTELTMKADRLTDIIILYLFLYFCPDSDPNTDSVSHSPIRFAKKSWLKVLFADLL